MKTYNFYEAKNGLENPTVLEVKEQDLTQDQQQLILGTFINEFEKLPKRIQGEFTSFIINKAMANSDYELKPKNR